MLRTKKQMMSESDIICNHYLTRKATMTFFPKQECHRVLTGLHSQLKGDIEIVNPNGIGNAILEVKTVYTKGIFGPNQVPFEICHVFPGTNSLFCNRNNPNDIHSHLGWSVKQGVITGEYACDYYLIVYADSRRTPRNFFLIPSNQFLGVMHKNFPDWVNFCNLGKGGFRWGEGFTKEGGYHSICLQVPLRIVKENAPDTKSVLFPSYRYPARP